MIAIMGLKMPSDCLSCPFVTGAFGICDHIHCTRIPGQRLPDCPLREVKPLVASHLIEQDDYDIVKHEHEKWIAQQMARTLYESGCITFDGNPPPQGWALDDRREMVELRGTVVVVLPNGRT